jgi:hypothetical protein
MPWASGVVVQGTASRGERGRGAGGAGQRVRFDLFAVFSVEDLIFMPCSIHAVFSDLKCSHVPDQFSSLSISS